MIDHLMNIGFTKYEAIAYIKLLEHGDLNGYELSKQSKIPKANAYSTLETMLRKGYVYKIEEEKVKYGAVDFTEIREEIMSRLEKEMDYVEHNLPQKVSEPSKFITIAGYQNLLSKLSYMISSAQYNILLDLHKKEYDANVANVALQNFANNGMENRIHLIQGDTLEVLPDLTGSYDLIFLDVDKRLYEPLLDDCIRLLSDNGVLIAEDTLFPAMDLHEKWHYLIPGIESFNRAVILRDDIMSTILPIGDGLTVIKKKL